MSDCLLLFFFLLLLECNLPLQILRKLQLIRRLHKILPLLCLYFHSTLPLPFARLTKATFKTVVPTMGIRRSHHGNEY